MAVLNFGDEEIKDQNELIQDSAETPSSIQRSEFPSEGLMKRGVDDISYSVVPDNTINWDNSYDHSQSIHAPSDAQKNSDILKSEIEVKLIGEIASHTHAPSDEEVEWTHAHCSIDSVDITSNTVTVPFDSLPYNDNVSRYTVSNGELTIGISDRYLFCFTVTTNQIAGNSRSESTVWLESDTGSGFVEKPNTRGYIYSRQIENGHGAFSIQLGMSVLTGDKFRVRVARHSGSGTLVVQADASHGFVMTVPGRGPKGDQGDLGPTGNLGTHETDYNHDAFLTTKTDVEGVLTGTISTHTHTDIDLVKQVLYGTFVEQSGTSTIPRDTSIPTVSEGTQVMSQTITPKTLGNKIRIQSNVNCGYGNGKDDFGLAFTVFRGTTNIGTVQMWTDRSDWGLPCTIDIMDTPNTVSPVTYSIRVGKLESKGTWYVGRGPDNLFGSSTGSNGWTLSELEI